MDDDLFDKFGLPKELNVGDSIAKENQTITLTTIKKKFGKKYTVVDGIDTKEVDIKSIAKKLKAKFACGGTAKGGVIELQGDHLGNIKKALVDLGFAPESISEK